MKKLILFLFILPLFVIVVSCDLLNTEDYVVENDYPVSVVVQNAQGAIIYIDCLSDKYDTTFTKVIIDSERYSFGDVIRGNTDQYIDITLDISNVTDTTVYYNIFFGNLYWEQRIEFDENGVFNKRYESGDKR